MNSKLNNFLSLPAYTTITAQSFSHDGQFLAIANDQGKIAVYKVVNILEKLNPLHFTFDAGTCLDPKSQARGCINALATISDTLIVAISRPSYDEAAIVAFHWKDLIQQRVKLSWTIEHSSGLLPTDVNSIALDMTNDVKEK